MRGCGRCAARGRPGGGRDGGEYEHAVGAIAAGLRGAGPAEAPGRLCAVAVDLLPVDGASVSLRGDSMPLQLAASGGGAARLAQLQATLGDGPCHHVLRTGAPVLARDLVEGACGDRWPVFTQQALGSGVRAVYALPLGSKAVCVGTLDLYSASPGASPRTSCTWPCWWPA
ncbi:GAF domain-containing protein [Streptomyces thermocarboxydus]